MGSYSWLDFLLNYFSSLNTDGLELSAKDLDISALTKAHNSYESESVANNSSRAVFSESKFKTENCSQASLLASHDAELELPSKPLTLSQFELIVPNNV